MNAIFKILFSIVDYALWAISTVLFYKLLTLFVSPKPGRLPKIAGIVGSFYLVGIMIFPEEMVNLLGSFLLFVLMMILCFGDSFMQRTAVVCVLFPLIIAINFLTENLGLRTYLALGGVLRETMGNELFDSSNYSIMDSSVHLFFSIIRTCFWFLLYHLLRRRLPNVKRFLTTRLWGMICIIGLAPLSGIVSLVLFADKVDALVYPAMISSIVTIVGILLFTGYLANTVGTTLENKNLKLQQTYYGELEHNQRETAKLRHDMNNHLGVIATLIENGKTEEARSYYESLSGTLLAKTRVFCKNSIVNAVINAKYNKAEEAQIDCFFNIDLGNLLAIDDISLCSIYANSLDNAIEACQLISDLSKRKISLKARYSQGFFSYEIANAKENPILEKNGVPLTNKIDKKKHGYGLANIRDIVAAYDGDFSVTHTGDSFALTILLKNL